MKLKLRLRNKNHIFTDSETKITWEGNKIVESKVTPAVAQALGKNVLEIVGEKNGK